MSETVIAKHNIKRMSFIGFSIVIELAAIGESVVFFGHYQAVQFQQ